MGSSEETRREESGASPRGGSPPGSPFLRARAYFAGIANIRDYSQSRGFKEQGNYQTWS